MLLQARQRLLGRRERAAPAPIWPHLRTDRAPQTCGGGLWWSADKTYKNAITNELYLVTAMRLWHRCRAAAAAASAAAAPRSEGDPSFLQWAQREWHWFANSSMINAECAHSTRARARRTSNHEDTRAPITDGS